MLKKSIAPNGLIDSKKIQRIQQNTEKDTIEFLLFRVHLLFDGKVNAFSDKKKTIQAIVISMKNAQHLK